ncbi:lysozyme [Brevundimonas bullata]|uniref:Lysozyme n=1 Tax=Brevundimonas bullata TaxID=13160 RepID=A0A7W7IKZ7_9CAUL|nr:glycoside hydrolase family protein [Brevundimonas bullata]MBB4796289.1 lysozyme [Brevundimonas bullata]MBB6381249.1 lysozyme [Brevundimonas bullata]
MDRKALFDAVRPYAPGAKLRPEWVPMIDALADAMGLPRGAGAPGGPDPELIAALKKDEGLRLKAYPDPLSPRARTGKGSGAPWTIGYGRARGIQEGQVITEATAEAWLVEDAREHNTVIHAALPWLKRLDPVRRRVVENMHFNMGWDNPKTPSVEGLAQFKNTLSHIEAGRYAEAAAAMRVSLWAKQVKGRAVRLAREMETGRVAQ